MPPRHFDRQGNEISFIEWARLFESEDRRVAHTRVGDVEISTVWMGLDHSYARGQLPLVYETMVFGGPMDQFTARYTSEDQAKEGHEATVIRVHEGRTCGDVADHEQSSGGRNPGVGSG